MVVTHTYKCMLPQSFKYDKQIVGNKSTTLLHQLSISKWENDPYRWFRPSCKETKSKRDFETLYHPHGHELIISNALCIQKADVRVYNSMQRLTLKIYCSRCHANTVATKDTPEQCCITAGVYCWVRNFPPVILKSTGSHTPLLTNIL